MKKFSVSLAVLALALVLGLAFVGCKNEVEDDPLNGTYVREGTIFTINNGNWSFEGGIEYDQRGTYTVKEGIITFTTNEVYFTPEMVQANAGWKNKSQTTAFLKELGFTDDIIINEFIDAAFESYTATYAGNTITFSQGFSVTRQ